MPSKSITDAFLRKVKPPRKADQWSMMLGMVRCDVLSAADNAIAVIPGVDAMTWKEGAFSLGDRRHQPNTIVPSTRSTAA